VKERTLAALAYHKIGAPVGGGWSTWFYVPEETFAAHLRLLQEEGWTVIDLPTFLKGLADPETLPEKAALLTFDDGYRSMRSVTLPLLIEFGHPAVLFVPTDFVGWRNDFDPHEPREPICGWEDLRYLEEHGVSVQSHGASHRSFSDLGLSEQLDELVRSRVALEDALEKPVEVFAYPYGDGGTQPRETAKALRGTGYRAAFLYKGGPARLPAADPYRLTRLAMGPDTNLRAELEMKVGKR
jgi:peptidoglycan/xylan/chitin deacetylase (PgdA/CDA1 family)